MTTGRPRGRPAKVAEARSPLRGRGTVRVIPAAPAASAHELLMGKLEPDAFGIRDAAQDAPWLRVAFVPALRLAQLVGAELLGMPGAHGQTDEVGTLPAFPEEKPEPAALRTLAPLMVGLLSDLGMTPQALARMGVQLTEENPEPAAPPAPRRLPRSSR